MKLIELGRVVARDFGSYQRIKIYYLGWIHGMGTTHTARFIFGLQGKETEVTRDVIKPVRTFVVREK